MMRNIILISSLLIILLFPYSSLADTGVSSINPAVAKLSQQIWDSGLSLFKGEVELISSSGIYIDLKGGAGIKEGMECEVFRGVEERREKCAEVRIRWAGERMAIAEPLAGYSLESIKVGDEVMAKPTFRRILVLDFVTSRGEKNNFTDLVSQILASDLLDFPQIQVIRESQLSLDLRKKIALLRKGEGFDPSIAQSIGNFGGIILGTATDLGVVIDLRVSVIDTGTGLVRAVAAEDIIKDISVSLLFSPSAKPSEDKYMLKRRSQLFDFRIIDLAVGDVISDGQKEIVVLTSDKLLILSWDGSFFREVICYDLSLTSLKTQRSREMIRNLVLIDLDDDGKEEIFISDGIREGGDILKWDGGNLIKVGFIQGNVILSQKEKKTLIVTHLAEENNYYLASRTTKQTLISPEKIEKTRLNIPTDFYTLLGADIDGDKLDDWVVVDNSDKIRVYNSNLIENWTSDTDYGVGLAAYDLDLNGRAEVIATSANPFGEGDQLYFLEWEDDNLVEKWRSEKIEGSIFKLAIGDADNDGLNELIADIQVESEGEVKSILYFYVAGYAG